jgi:hypothetical protein
MQKIIAQRRKREHNIGAQKFKITRPQKREHQNRTIIAENKKNTREDNRRQHNTT